MWSGTYFPASRVEARRWRVSAQVRPLLLGNGECPHLRWLRFGDEVRELAAELAAAGFAEVSVLTGPPPALEQASVQSAA